MKVLALRLVEVEGPCPWCLGVLRHTPRCSFYGQSGTVPPKPLTRDDADAMQLEITRQ